MDDPKKELGALLPAEISGWRAQPDEDQLFDPETIFDYLDGAGEVYRSYNFKRVLSRRYEREGRAALIADLFDMGSSRDAFGVFTHDLEGESGDVGQDSRYKGGLLSFWRDRFFVSLTAEAETEETRAALFALGRAAAASIGRDGERPDVLRFLPRDFREGGDIRYFHTHHILNYHLFISAENILGLGPGTEALLSSRAGCAGREYLLLVRYPGADGTVGALDGFSRKAMPGFSRQGDYLLRQEGDGRWTGAAARGRTLIVALRAPSAEKALEQLRAAADLTDPE